jgi:hypothetical protein
MGVEVTGTVQERKGLSMADFTYPVALVATHRQSGIERLVKMTSEGKVGVGGMNITPETVTLYNKEERERFQEAASVILGSDWDVSVANVGVLQIEDKIGPAMRKYIRAKAPKGWARLAKGT